jgi:hypothetical protein
MSSASQYVKFGGCLGFSAVFLLVLLKNRDIVGALMDASIACVIMAFVFKQLHGYTSSLGKKVKEAKKTASSAKAGYEEESGYNSLTDDRAE